MNSFKYVRIAEKKDALELISAEKNAKFIGGGTNIIDLWKYNLVHPVVLLDLNRLQEFKIIEQRGQELFLGALATNSETAYHADVLKKYPLLSKAILAGASAQIRNSATNGGNLLQKTRCYYFYDAAAPCNKRNPGSGCPAKTGLNRMHAILGHSEACIAVFPSDMCVALSALDARVQVESAAGKREINFEDFHRLPGNTPEMDNNLGEEELITGLLLPEEGFAKNYSYLKLRDRNSYAFAMVSVATGILLENETISKISIALGGIAAKPWRVKSAEAFLAGKKPTAENFSQAAAMILEGAKGFKHNSFKIELSKRAIVRNCLMALDPDSQRPGAQPSL